MKAEKHGVDLLKEGEKERNKGDKNGEIEAAEDDSGASDAASHMNLGAMLHLNGKYEEAERSYVKSLELRPNDATTLTNLERLHNLFEKRGIKRRKER
ncbi:unnamed protein product [Notodromas monacha]|uniref:Uncharacterized protein n=1 Tax=Notodromas monacha TaxID=399045 RepID=A0A7R9BY63_9CRUS|nr:unnamed protein product [Notodromas monacha]CAG0923838.1 unnamed protein product [Notodromas monacha]